MSISSMASSEYEVVIPSAYPLAASLTLPEPPSGGAPDAKFPVIIMLHGSGMLDRDENAKQGRINAFKELSDFVVPLGFATLRYDKRGCGKSGGDFWEAGFFDLVDDAAAAVAFARSHPRLDPERIILLGHSEGCMIAPAVNERIPVQGMILLAPAAEPLGHAAARQREQVYAALRELSGFAGRLVRLLRLERRIRRINDKLLQRVAASQEPVVRFMGKKINAKWMREHDAFDVREPLKKVSCPVLSVAGAKDLQVNPEDARTICSLVQGPCEAHVIPNMTHILRKTDRPPDFLRLAKDYRQQLKAPLDAELMEIIGRWLRGWLAG